MAMSKDMGDRTGWVAVVFHGQGDIAAFANTLKAIARARHFPSDDRPVQISRDGDLDIIETGFNGTFIIGPTGLFVAVDGPAADRTKQAANEIVRELKTGKNRLEGNTELKAVIGNLDRSTALWAAGI